MDATSRTIHERTAELTMAEIFYDDDADLRLSRAARSPSSATAPRATPTR